MMIPDQIHSVSLPFVLFCILMYSSVSSGCCINRFSLIHSYLCLVAFLLLDFFICISFHTLAKHFSLHTCYICIVLWGSHVGVSNFAFCRSCNILFGCFLWPLFEDFHCTFFFDFGFRVDSFSMFVPSYVLYLIRSFSSFTLPRFLPIHV